MHEIKGIIFDMDNTLLQSNIDFEQMKRETFQFLSGKGILPDDFPIVNHTSSTIIEAAIKTNRMSESLINEMWEIPKNYEVLGMKDAKLENGVVELLEKLNGNVHLAIVTNNSLEAAEKALSDHDIRFYFDHVLGRGTMKSLKPSSDGFLQILEQYENTLPDEWLSVGDSWIDGKGSMDAGIDFIAYRADVARMNEMGVYPIGSIEDIIEVMSFI